jgi:hypothetical protein
MASPEHRLIAETINEVLQLFSTSALVGVLRVPYLLNFNFALPLSASRLAWLHGCNLAVLMLLVRLCGA